MSFGSDVLVFKHLVKVGNPDAQGNYQMAEVSFSAFGSRHRPLSFQETVDLQFDIATEAWRSTLPLKDYPPALLASLSTVKNNDYFTVDGLDYQIVGGVRPFGDLASVPFKMTIISQRHHA